jgi:hypothetical protein
MQLEVGRELGIGEKKLFGKHPDGAVASWVRLTGAEMFVGFDFCIGEEGIGREWTREVEWRAERTQRAVVSVL